MSVQYNTVIAGDCRAELRRFAASTFDFVLTDPPYMVGYESRDGRRIEGDRSDEWVDASFAEIARVMRDNSYCVSFYGWSRVRSFMRAWDRARLRPVGHFVWTKPYASADRLVRHRHEQAYLLAKGDPRRPAFLVPDVLDWEYSGNRLHPTQKPVSALIPLLLAFSKPGDIVLDPFCGSGSTLAAAELLGRRYVGIELDKGYAAAAAQRLEGMSA